MLSETMTQKDGRLLWHPYTQHGLQKSGPLEIESAQGAVLRLRDGREVIDAISSWWVNLHGHGHPRIVRAVAEQARRLDHVMFAGFTHEPAALLSEKLLKFAQILNPELSRVFFSDNGSSAVEAALKIAFQYQIQIGQKNRTRFLALRGGYHGDTLGAMAVSEPEGFHRIFRPLLPEVDFVTPDEFGELERTFARPTCPYAGFIFEPLIQGAAGMRTYSPEFLRATVELCRGRGVLCIADEVFTGFYRTGTCFASERARICPDLVCLSKGLSGGVLPIAATLATEEVFSAFYGTEIRKAFLHGHSFTANPIACAAGIASLELLSASGYKERIAEICRRTQEAVHALNEHPGVQSTRVSGTIGAVDVKGEMDYFSRSPEGLMRIAIEHGVLLRPLGRTLYAVPPYCITNEEIEKIYRTIEEIIHYGV